MSASPSNTVTSPSRRRYVLGLPFWVYILLAAGGAATFMQTQVPDQGMANGMTMPVLFVAALLCLAWFTLFSSYSRNTRWLVFGIALMCFGGLAACLMIEGLTGNIIPIIKPRPWLRDLLGWTHHEPAPPAPVTNAAGRVDLFTTTPHDFPQFLGPQRSASVSTFKLARGWEAHPPKQLWRQSIGAGWSGFTVVNGFAVTLEQRGEQELVTCYELTTGKLRWSHATDARYDTWIGGIGPRSTPTIHMGRVYALGATGKLHCLDGATGEPVWSRDLLKEFGLTKRDEQELVLYGRANSPLIVEDRVIVPAGGPKDRPRWSLAAFHQDSGVLVWKEGTHNVSYSSPTLATLAGVPQILSVNENFVSGHDPKTGRVLWEMDWPGITSKDANISQAVPVPPNRVFLSKGYGQGAMLIELSAKDDGTLSHQQIYHNRDSMKTKFTNVTIKDGYVYGLSDGILECMELETGKRMWRDGRYGHGQILRADDLLLVLAEDGELFLVEATPQKRNHVLGNVPALEGRTWNNLALAGPYLLVRNGREAVCYQLAVADN